MEAEVYIVRYQVPGSFDFGERTFYDQSIADPFYNSQSEMGYSVSMWKLVKGKEAKHETHA
jgi:hypothetical protein